MKFAKQVAIGLIFLSIIFYSATAYAGPLVAIDPGHGGWDSGALGPNGLKEKDVNLDIGLRLDTLLKANGYGSIMTRRTDIALGLDLNSDLGGRVDIANNAGADIFVSIHNNSSFSPSAGGSETYYYTNKSGWSDPNSRLLAKLVQQEVVTEVGRYSRGVKTANFYVLRNSSMQAILVEGLFISNSNEEALLNDPNVRQKIAQGIFNGIKKYFSMVHIMQTSVWMSVSNGKHLSSFKTIWQGGKGKRGSNASKLVSGDFNGDGKDDLAVLYGYSGSQCRVWVFINNGAGGFKEPAVWWDSGLGNWDMSGSKLTVGDFNGDKKSDLAILYGYAAQRDVKVFVLPSDGTKFTGANEWWHAGPGNWDWVGTKLKAGDFNGDNKDDLVAFYGYATQRQTRAFVFTAGGTTATPSFNSPAVWWDSGPGNWDWVGSKLAVGDFNGDNKDDLAAFYGYAIQRQTRAFVFIATGATDTPSFSAPAVWWDSGPGNWDWVGSKLTAGDFNGDNKDDLAVLYGYSGAQTRLWMFLSAVNNNKFDNPSSWWDSGSGNWDWARTKFVSGNFDGDGKSDLSGLYNSNY